MPADPFIDVRDRQVRRWRERRSGRQDAYYAVAPATRWQLATAYVLLAVVCLVGMHATYAPIPVG